MVFDEIKRTVVVPEKIEIREKGDYDILVVFDRNMNRYSSADRYLRNHVMNNRDRYLGSRWQIAFEESGKGGYMDLLGFLSPVAKPDSFKEGE